MITSGQWVYDTVVMRNFFTELNYKVHFWERKQMFRDVDEINQSS